MPEQYHDSAGALTDRVLLRTPIVTIVEFRCGPDEPQWSRENRASGHVVVFPRDPVLISQADRDPVVADANQVMFYNADQRYTRARISDAGDRCEYFALNPQVAMEVTAPHRRVGGSYRAAEDGPLFPFASGPGRAGAYLAQRLIYEHVRSARAPDVLRVEEVFLSVLRAVVGDAFSARGLRGRVGRERTRRARAECAETVKSILAVALAERLTLSEIAGRVEVSSFHLCRLFRAHTGIPIYRYRDRLRLRASLEPIADGRRDLTSIAHELGYNSHSHFTGAFRREFAITPSAFRRRASASAIRNLSNLTAAG